MQPSPLALAASLFPADATVHGSRTRGEQLANSLRALTFFGGHVTAGYQEVAAWSVVDSRAGTVPIKVTYDATAFSSADEARAAVGSARQNLWQHRRPWYVPGLDLPAFEVREGSQAVIIAPIADGRVAAEASLSVPAGMETSAIRMSPQLRHLIRIARNTTRVALRYPITNTQGSVVSSLPIYVAPPGTAPIVVSPSLLTLDRKILPQLDARQQGYFRRRTADQPGAAGRTLVYLEPPRGLSTYDVISPLRGGGLAYGSITLYRTSGEAARAFGVLRKQNDREPSLTRVATASYRSLHRWQALVQGAGDWQRGNERIIGFRVGNLVHVMATTSPSVIRRIPHLVDGLLQRMPTRLHVEGTRIVTAAGDTFQIHGMNWYGGETPNFVPGGLEFQPYQYILQTIAASGVNTLRIPFSNELVERNPVIHRTLGPNPSLQGLHALDILDRLVGYAGAIGLRVILDDHRAKPGFGSEPNGLWYDASYPPSAFVPDWRSMARRFGGTTTVIGVDLHNELHGPATWGTDNKRTDWRLAATTAGDAVLAVQPNLLIMAEGIETYRGHSYWWGGNLMGVAHAPIRLRFPDGRSARDRLVYSAHEYGPDDCTGVCPWFTRHTTAASLARVREQHWAYVAADAHRSYAAPVWLGEFGTCGRQAACVRPTGPGSQGQWFTGLVRFLAQRHLNFTYWAANGTKSSGQGRYGLRVRYGYLTRDWVQPVPLLWNALRPLLQP